MNTSGSRMNPSSASATAVTVGTVLVAEDDPAAADVVGRLITGLGHRVTTVPDGALALQSAAELPPDLILLDVELPHIDGIEVCRRLKNAADTRLIPVVLITGLTNEDRVRGIKAGADDFLVKPFHPEELEARVTSLLRLKRYTDELELAASVIVGMALTVEERSLHQRPLRAACVLRDHTRRRPGTRIRGSRHAVPRRLSA